MTGAVVVMTGIVCVCVIVQRDSSGVPENRSAWTLHVLLLAGVV